MDKTTKLRAAGLVIVCIATVISFVNGFVPYESRNDVKDVNVVCWGDSLTEGIGADATDYPTELQRLIEENQSLTANVVNKGISGESSISIAVRAGGINIYTTQTVEFGLFDKTKTITFTTEDGKIAEPWHDSKWTDINVSINNVDGKLSFDGETYSYYFTRNNIFGKDIIPASSKIVIEDVDYEEYIPVIFIGQNGIYEDAYDLISQQKSILTQEQLSNGRFVILGLTYGSYEDNHLMEEIMKDEWKGNYVNLREYLCNNALTNDMDNLTLEDMEILELGMVPQLYRNEDDLVHLNDLGYQLVAKAVYEKMEELDLFQ